MLVLGKELAFTTNLSTTKTCRWSNKHLAWHGRLAWWSSKSCNVSMGSAGADLSLSARFRGWSSPWEVMDCEAGTEFSVLRPVTVNLPYVIRAPAPAASTLDHITNEPISNEMLIHPSYCIHSTSQRCFAGYTSSKPLHDGIIQSWHTIRHSRGIIFITTSYTKTQIFKKYLNELREFPICGFLIFRGPCVPYHLAKI